MIETLGAAGTGLAVGAAVLVGGRDRRRVAERLVPLEGGSTGGRAAALVGAGLCSAAAGLLLVGLATTFLAAACLVAWGLLRRARRREAEALQRERALRDGIRGLAASARSGLSVRRAIEEVAREEVSDVAEPFRAAARDLAMGRPMPAALAGLSDRLASREGALLTGVISIHHRVGGDLPRALDEVADLADRRAEARRRLRALTAQGRASGAVLAVLPVAFVGLLSGTSGNGLGTFYGTPRGAALLGLGILLQIAGYLWIRVILRRAQP